MKYLLKLEEIAMLGICIYWLVFSGAPAAWYFLLLLGPDISMLGYLAGAKTGAFCYNLFHHKAIALLLFVAGLITGQLILQFTGIILFGHSSMDRALGYGLKLEKGFQFTHLGRIGKKAGPAT